LRAYPEFSRMMAVVLTPADGFPGHLEAARPTGCVCWPRSVVADRLRGLIDGMLCASTPERRLRRSSASY
jgi:hypothetical protein